MRLQGEFTLETEPQRLVKLLSDPEKVVECLPHLVSWSSSGEGRIKATFRVDVGGVVDYLSRLKADVEIEVVEKDSSTVKYKFTGRIARAQYNGTITVRISQQEHGGSRIEWEADVELGRVLKLLGFFVDVDNLVERIVDDAVKSLSSCTKARGEP
jgi:hypothetical protein